MINHLLLESGGVKYSDHHIFHSEVSLLPNCSPSKTIVSCLTKSPAFQPLLYYEPAAARGGLPGTEPLDLLIVLPILVKVSMPYHVFQCGTQYVLMTSAFGTLCRSVNVSIF